MLSKKINTRIAELGEDSLYIFTGNIRWNQLKSSDLGITSEEWVGPSLFYPQLKEKALDHLGGDSDKSEVAVFNRTSAGIVSSIMALVKPGNILVSFAPDKKAHPSVSRGAKLAGAKLYEVDTIEELKNVPESSSAVCVVTGVTSELLLLDQELFVEAIKMAKLMNMIVIVDDAYGARIRTILLNQPTALEAGADIVITNNDKAALHGPRAGIMAGNKELVMKASAKASEYGMEARAPIALGVLRSLEQFKPEELIGEMNVGQSLYEGLSKKMGEEYVRKTLLGPEISADNALRYILKRRGMNSKDCAVVPS